MLPERIGPYEIDGVLGRGGMGVVYRGRDEAGAAVAVKTILVGADADERLRRRFRRELQALSRLRHPNIVGVLASGEGPSGAPWFCMPLIQGESLQERLDRSGPLEITEVATLGRQLAGALGAAHVLGLLHRDVKPANVLCSVDGRYVLTDFGLVKELEIEESIRLSRTGQLQGSPGYWAPEQAAGKGKESTPATDVYQAGATLYAALTGVPPIQGDTLLEVAVAAQQRPPKPPAELREDAPSWLSAVLLRCLEKRPANRYPTAEALGEALVPPLQPSGARWESRALALLLLATAALVLASAALWPGAAPPPTEATAPSPASAPEPKSEPEPEPEPGPEPPPLTPREQEATELYDLGMQRFQEGKDQEAAGALRSAAELGHARAMVELGLLLENGRGVDKDEAEAFGWYRRSAELGDPEAMNAIGFMYSAGKGVHRDHAAAVAWFQRAADLDHAQAARNLASMWERGRGVRKNPAEAMRWLRRAAELRNVEAMLKLGEALAEGDGVPRDVDEAVVWLQRAAAQDDDPGLRRRAARALRRIGPR